MIRLKTAWIISLAFLIVVLFPYRPGILLSKSRYLLVRPQECGCECPDMLILKGNVVIPKSLAKKCSNIHTWEINLTKESLKSGIDLSLNCDYYIKGHVVGLDTIECDRNGCEMAPVYNIDKYYTAEYVPYLFMIKSKVIAILFFLDCLMCIPAFTIISVVEWITKKKKNK